MGLGFMTLLHGADAGHIIPMPGTLVKSQLADNFELEEVLDKNKNVILGHLSLYKPSYFATHT